MIAVEDVGIRHSYLLLRDEWPDEDSFGQTQSSVSFRL